MKRFVAVFAVFVIPTASVDSQTLYRCQTDNKVTYSDRPCITGTEKRIQADGGPTPEQQAQARAKLQRQVSEQEARTQIQSQVRPTNDRSAGGVGSTGAPREFSYDERIRYENLRRTTRSLFASDETKETAQREMKAIESGLDRRLTAEDRRARDNHSRSTSSIAADVRAKGTGGVKEIHDRYLTTQEREQQTAEEAARSRKSAATAQANAQASAARAQADAEAARAARTTAAAAEADAARLTSQQTRPVPSTITNCDGAGCWDDVGNRYNRGAGTTSFRSDGKICQTVGNMVHCN